MNDNQMLEGEDTHPSDYKCIITPSRYAVELIPRMISLMPIVSKSKSKLYECTIEGIENSFKKTSNPWGNKNEPYMISGYRTLLKTIEADELRLFINKES
jgi:hypothetical protein